MASFVSLSGSMVMKSGVKFGRDGILSEKKFQLVNTHHKGKDTTFGESVAIAKSHGNTEDRLDYLE